MEDEGEYEVDYEVDDTVERPATLELRPEPEYEPEPELRPEPEYELESEPRPEPEYEPEPEPQPEPGQEREPELEFEGEQEAEESQPELDIAEQLEQLELKHNKAIKRRFGSSWKRPPTFVYPSNFGFGVNMYQTMIDYLDKKDAGERVNKDDVHLPLLEERCLRQYEAERPFRWYDNHDIDQYTHKGEKIRTQIRQNDAVGVGNVLNRTHTNWSMTRKWMQLLKKSHVVDYRNAHKDELDARAYRSPTPGGSPFYPSHTPGPLKAAAYLSPALKPKTSSLDDLASGLASVLLSMVQSRMDQEQMVASRRSRLREIDDRFDNTLDEIYSQMRRIGSRPEPPPPVRQQLDLNDLDVSARNKIRRAEELRDMQDYVNELTSLNSARNTLRENMRASAVDRDILDLDSRLENMKNLQHSERMKHTSSDYEIDLLRAEIAARRSSASPAAALLADSSHRLPKGGSRPPYNRPVQLSAIDHLSCRPREIFNRDDVISDVSARVLKRAGEVGGEPTDEQRRINSRARFVNLTRRRPNTGDVELTGPSSRVERNIDHMARSLASRGTCQRRYDVDDEMELPYQGPFPTTRIDPGDFSVSRLLERPQSPSVKVRAANSRALARNTLLGY